MFDFPTGTALHWVSLETNAPVCFTFHVALYTLAYRAPVSYLSPPQKLQLVNELGRSEQEREERLITVTVIIFVMEQDYTTMFICCLNHLYTSEKYNGIGDKV